jgi:Raf kinase inhibitor-like YbhB/YbcL family protein
VVLVAIAVAMVLLAGCGTSGRELRDPIPGATAPARKPDATVATTSTTTAVLDTAAPVAFTISSTAWASGDAIPVEFTCGGEDVSPSLSIAGVPSGTVELMLVVRDKDDGGYRQWVVAAIPPTDPDFPRGEVPQGAIEVPNDSASTAWAGPCPPKTTGTHTYDFTVYALSQPSRLRATSTAAEVTAAADGALDTTAMSGTYRRS